MRKRIKMFRVALLMSAVALTCARIYERCELARDLIRLGVNSDHVATWVCIAFHESRFDTAARNPHSGDHGLLQISELYWCGPGKACGAPCSAFRDNDISDDVQCALRIYEEHTRLQGDGFLAWVVYPHHCKHNAKKYLVDCDTSKSTSKFEDRARYLKTYEKNNTSPSQLLYPDIHKLRPPPQYLAINNIFKGDYVNEFEKNYYNNKKPFNWLNFKIDNIDELKLPVVGKHQISEFTTPSTTTTTIDPILIGIKPPSPRKIESNQFRRRMLKFETPKDENDDYFTVIKTTAPPIMENDFLAHNPFINRARALSRLNLNLIEYTTTKPTTIFIPKTTKQNISTKNTNYNSYTISPYYNSARRGKSRYVTDINYFSEETKTERPIVINPGSLRNNISYSESNISSGHPMTINNDKRENVVSTTSKSISTKNMETTTKHEVTTKSPAINRSTLRLSSRFTWNYQTTPKPRYTFSTISNSVTNSTGLRNQTFTSSTSASTALITTTTPRTTTTSSKPLSTTPTTTVSTVRTTQSIFDLYLNPTRATFKPINFASFDNSPIKLRIFSGGTTTLPSSYIKRNN